MTQESPLSSQTYPEASQATTTLILGVVGILGGTLGFLVPFFGLISFPPVIALLGLLSPVAWYLGRREMKAIDEGRRDPAFRSNAKVGMILGIVGTVIIVIGIAILILIIILLSTYTF